MNLIKSELRAWATWCSENKSDELSAHYLLKSYGNGTSEESWELRDGFGGTRSRINRLQFERDARRVGFFCGDSRGGKHLDRWLNVLRGCSHLNTNGNHCFETIQPPGPFTEECDGKVMARGTIHTGRINRLIEQTGLMCELLLADPGSIDVYFRKAVENASKQVASVNHRAGRPADVERNATIYAIVASIQDWKRNLKNVVDQLHTRGVAPPRGRTSWMDALEEQQDRHFIRYLQVRINAHLGALEAASVATS